MSRSYLVALVSFLVATVTVTIFCYINKDNGIVLLPHAQVAVKGHNDNATKLPSLEKGGILFFLHVPKTGGTSIRELVKYRKGGRRSRVNYIYLTGPREYNDTVEKMKTWVVHGTGTVENSGQQKHIGAVNAGTVVVIEYHALDRNCPSFLQMSQTVLPEWKRLAEENGVAFFSFANIREPISMSISFFNYYHAIPQNPKRFDLLVANEDDEATTTNTSRKIALSPSNIDNKTLEQVFVDATIQNPQCLFLVYNEDAYTKTGQDLRDRLTHEDCRQAYSNIRELFDWVGSTDKIRNETLPLLQKLFQTNPYTKRLIRNLNKTANQASTQKAPIHQSTLSLSTIEYIRTATVWDQEMYESIEKDFSYEKLRREIEVRLS